MHASIVVAGCGMIGSAVAADLVRSGAYDVTVVDADADRLKRLAAPALVKTVHADMSAPGAVAALTGPGDVIVGALPSGLGCEFVRGAIECGRSVVDISFMPEDALALDDIARRNDAVALVDCGVAPGLSHMMAAAAAAELTDVERVEILIGGLPAVRGGLFDYKAGFSPYDVLEEYVRPVRVVENGRIAVKEALDEPELVDVPGVGTLEAFLTDGLRTLPRTVHTATMVEKTLRYPGHRAAMAALGRAGFFSKEPIAVGGAHVRPIDVAAALLFPGWTYAEGEPDLTILIVRVEGTCGTERRLYTWTLLDRYDPATRLRSMSRTTAFTAAAVARLVVDGEFPPGVHPPEVVGQRGFLPRVLKELDERGIRCEGSVRSA